MLLSAPKDSEAEPGGSSSLAEDGLYQQSGRKPDVKPPERVQVPVTGLVSLNPDSTG